MGGDSDLGERMETVAQRVDFLELLADDGPLPPRDIVDALDYSRPTVTRALKALREADLVEKDDGGYTPTVTGVMAAEEYRRYETTARAILSAGDLLAPVPETHALPPGVLTDADTILADAGVPVRALEAVSDRIRQAETVRAYLPTLVNTHLLRVWHRAVVGTSVDTEVGFDPDLLTVLKGQYPHLLSEMAAADGFSAYATTGPPYGVVLATEGDTTTVSVIVYEDDAAVRGVLTNDSAEAIDWGRTELERLGTEATEVTDELDALSAALADGVAGTEPRTDPSHDSGETHARGHDGHALPVDLEAEGFVRLSAGYFDTHRQAPPAVSWRTGFTLAEVQAGHAVDRVDAAGRNLTARLVEALGTGSDQVLLGPPGSGKSTTCMAVACEWYDRGLGPVLYRERGDGDRFESAALLEAYLRQTDGHALVVVEDAIRDEANDILEAMQSLDAEPSVSFLLDARTHEWRDPDTFDIDARRDAYRRTTLEEVVVPDLNERECERFVDRFAALVDADVDLSGAELFSIIEAGAAAGDDGLPAGDALVAQYYLARRYERPIDADASPATALDEAVRQTYRTVTAAEARLAPELAVLAALLTAAGIPVAREYLYAVAAEDEYAALDEAVAVLEGRLLFERDQPRAGPPSTYRTRHETWAMRFLEQFLTHEPTGRARERVGECVTRLLALADEPARRERIRRHLGGRTPHIHQIEADPRHWADELVDRLFSVGRTNASLAPLFGETTDDAIELPEACSAWTHLQQAYWRGAMNRTHGDLARAEREFRTLGTLAEDLEPPAEPSLAPGIPEFTGRLGDDADVQAHRTRWRAIGRTNLGRIADDRGEYESAEEHHKEALALFREIDDHEGEALSLKNLGVVAFHQTEFDTAREYGERSLAIAVEHDARRIESASRNNLATVAQQLGDTERAREYYEESLAIFRDLGNRSGEAHCLNNLGTVAREQGDHDQAREYHEESLAICRDIGNRPMEAINLTNLGTVARAQGDYDLAREYYEESLAISRDLGSRLGEASALNDLGTVARAQGDYDRARGYHEEALAIHRDVGDRSGEAHSISQLGTVARERGEYDRAREYHEESLAIARDLGGELAEATSRRQLGAVARERGDHDRARDHFEAALEGFQAAGDEPGVAKVRLEQGHLALARDDVALAREHGRAARETFEEFGRTRDVARGRLLLGRVEAADDAPETAREHWRTALDTFETVTAPQDALATLEELVECCRDRGADERAREWVERARELLADAPDATATRHRTWVERHADGLDEKRDG